MARAVEITSFKLAKGLSPADFVAANSDVDPWLRAQPGFVSRTMIAQEDGTILDMVIWESAAQAEDASARLMAELAGSPVHAAIDQRTVSSSIAAVFHQLG